MPSFKVAAFRALHAGPCFAIPNPYDAGSARLLESLGFRALATTSAGAAWSIGRPDGGAGRDAILANARAIAEAVDVPVSADLENCYAHPPDEAAQTITLAAAAGLAGGSIEDATGDAAEPIYPFDDAVARVAAAVAAAADSGFVLTARAEGFLHGQRDLNEVIRRLQAFERAGADVLYAPGLPDLDAVRAVCAAVSRPVNVLAGAALPDVAALVAAGARRISLGALLARAAFGAIEAAATELRDRGTCGFVAQAATSATVNGLMRRP